MSLVRSATPSILLSRNLCFFKCLGKSVVVSMVLMGKFEISTKLNMVVSDISHMFSSTK